jgi:CheY-like chemotaxis protein
LVANALVIEEKVQVPVKEDVVAEEVAVGSPDAEGEKLPFAGRTVLVADDEPDQVDFIAMVLEDNGATVLRAADGAEALAKARAERPDLLTLDLGMPGRDVGEVYETIRNDEDLKDLRVCIITGRPELRRLIYNRSVKKPEGYIDKPVDDEELVFNVKKVLGLK